MSDQLAKKVRSWLESEGYPFELQVGRTFHEAGWDVFYGHHYSDPATSKLREIDVHASFGPYVGDAKGAGMVSVHLLCECKMSLSKPWVIFTSGASDDAARLVSCLAPGEAASRVVTDVLQRGRRFFPTLSLGPRIGHALTRAFSNSKSGDPTGPYSAVLSALTAASALTAKHQSQAPSSWTSIYLPTVIVNGPLFEFFLDEAGGEVLEPCDHVHILAYPPGSEAHPLLVRIVVANGLESFATGMHEEARLLAQAALADNQ